MEHSTNSEQGELGPDPLGAQMILTVERWVLGAALVLSALALILWGTPHAAGSAAVGGLVAFLNLLVLRRTISGILGGSQRKRVALVVTLCLKMGLLLVAIWAAVQVLGFDPIGVGFGVSALVVGILGGTFFAQQRQRPDQVQPGR